MTNLNLYWISFYTIARKEVYRVFRIWTQTLLPPIITQSLYFVIFGTFIGSQIRGYENIGGYMGFIVPGLVMMAVITSSFSNVVSSFFGSKFQKNYEELLVSPTPNWVIIAGYTFGGVIRGLLIGLIVLLVSLFFVEDLPVQQPLIVFIFAFLTATAFSLGGFFNSLFAKSFDDVAIVPTFVLTPLTYLGGVFYSIKNLPEFWQNVSRFNPIVYMIDGFRYGFYGFNEFNISFSLLFLVSLNLALLGINWWLLNKGYGLKS
jgi:ABC-2 type transport system permease protein